jgi:hypothetical protein
MLSVNPKMLPRLDELEDGLLAAASAPSAMAGTATSKDSTSP